MSITKQQLEKLAERVNGNITITNELFAAVLTHNIRQATEVCWEWTAENGKATCGGIGALAEFINNGCKTVRWVGQRNNVRLAVNGVPVWTTANGG
jgi:hypothetical protein